MDKFIDEAIEEWNRICANTPFKAKRKDMEQYKNLDREIIEKTLKEIFSDPEHKFPIGTKHQGGNIYSISTGQSIIYTTRAGVEEFNKLMKEEFEKYGKEIDEEGSC
jgi:hypothetical protein